MESNFAITNDEKCITDSVIAYDESEINSNNSKNLGVFCGNLNDRLPKVISRTNALYVQFITDETVSDKGFVGEISFSYGKSSYFTNYFN